jgi:hypothetical protein
MGQVQGHEHLSDDSVTADRRRGGAVNRGHRWLIRLVRSRWVAMFAVAFAVSWSFHQVDEISRHRLERQQRVMQCTIQGFATAQALLSNNSTQRVTVKPILERCEKQQGK